MSHSTDVNTQEYVIDVNDLFDEFDDHYDDRDVRVWRRNGFTEREFFTHLLELLDQKLIDREATSTVDYAVSYLKRFGADPEYAEYVCHELMNSVFYIVSSSFPNMTHRELSRSRFVLDDQDVTLLHIHVRKSQ